MKFINKVNIALDEVEDEREHGIWVPNPASSAPGPGSDKKPDKTGESGPAVSMSIQSAEKRWEHYRTDILTNLDFVVNSNCNRLLKSFDVSSSILL